MAFSCNLAEAKVGKHAQNRFELVKKATTFDCTGLTEDRQSEIEVKRGASGFRFLLTRIVKRGHHSANLRKEPENDAIDYRRNSCSTAG